MIEIIPNWEGNSVKTVLCLERDQQSGLGFILVDSGACKGGSNYKI